MTVIQCRLSAVCLLHRDFSQNRLKMLCTIDNQIFIILAVKFEFVHRETSL